ncbi:MAG TPA: Ni/Fe-hydrogenase, b-type cytochrome subunit [Kineosporiaceae bacterium]|nr:Ni/Fe-hydrogenase, b-type cytochrome subunit [Kineosporiaceae bacterium]
MIHRTQLDVEKIELEIGEPLAFIGVEPVEVIRHAAMGAPQDSDDRLEQALAVNASLHGAVLPPATVLTHVPPGPGQPFSLTTVCEPGGETVRIARGEPRAVVETLLHPDNLARARAILSSVRLVGQAYRPLAIAVKRGDHEWELLGYLPVRAWRLPERRQGRPFDYHKVWDLWLRVAHWTWVSAIVVLTVTGYVIADPGWVPTAWVSGVRAGYFLGYVRFIHLTAAVVFILALLIRAWNLSTSRISYDRWRALIPFRSRHEVNNLLRTIRAYLFIGTHRAPEYFGHNPLQQLTYTSIYVIFLLQVLTGLSLWGLYDVHGTFWGLFQWVNALFGIQLIRIVHFMIMWVIILFLPAHVYLSIRADSVERSGAISSMVSGGRWIRRGAVFDDWPIRPRRPQVVPRWRRARRLRLGRRR